MYYYRLISSMSKAPSLDADAQLFITNAVITDNTQKSAINTLVLDFKSAGIWTKMKAIYPFVGGTASQHRFNLKDPRAINAAYYIDFIGGVTHSANGVLFNGSTGYANTKLAPNVMGLNSQHLSFYLRIDSSTTMGVAVNGYNWIDVPSNTQFRSPINLQSYSLVSASISGRIGFFLGNRNSSTNISLYKNATKLTNVNIASQYLETYPICISALNRNTSVDIAASNIFSFATIGDGLTDTEASALYSAIQTFQTTLNRQL